MTRSAFSSGASAHQTRVLLLPSEILAPFIAKTDGLMEISPLVRRSGLPGPFGLMALFLITSSLFARPGKAYPRFRGASLFFVYRPGLSGLNFTATNSHVHKRRPDGVPPLAVDSARPLHRVLLLLLLCLCLCIIIHPARLSVLTLPEPIRTHIHAWCIRHHHWTCSAPCPALPGFNASRMSRPALVVHTHSFLYFPFLDTLAFLLFRPSFKDTARVIPREISRRGNTDTARGG